MTVGPITWIENRHLDLGDEDHAAAHGIATSVETGNETWLNGIVNLNGREIGNG